ncbi:MAG: hypothetical protein IAF38_04870 [Bacteroidia bacterium]|nr:hypothetical protein [Bacteroidia bacterium]
MNIFLLSIGWWNFAGSFMMLGFLYEPFGQNVLNRSTKLFNEKFVLSYWTKLWLFWASGLNIFFGLINIMAVKWGHVELKTFLVWSDLVAYSLFTTLAIWGLKTKKLGSGVYSVFVIFAGWMAWGIYCLSCSNF